MLRIHLLKTNTNNVMSKSLKNNEIITGVDIYITRSGRIAFLEAVHERPLSSKAFSGYMYGRIGGKVIVRRLEWLPCGECVSSNDDGDHIVRRA